MASARESPKAAGGSGPVLEVLDEAECARLLGAGKVGRVGVTVGAMPAIFPVNYAVLDGSIVFRTVPGTKLRAALDRTVVAFEVDGLDEATPGGWSVLVVGVASELTGARREQALALPLEPWVPGDRDHVVAVSQDMISGRRLLPRPEPRPEPRPGPA